ncbi:MAG: MFS transporter [Proteobacteria bacterium]|uniref:MFS transporter n=1 Tax=Candidatus Avisuccinivibrio stercorigallinarum TaxID=2840704 RepID=A0A9D9DEP5_9GAMM|nr:MFS transporter [Candidatus Avisuccinivibrio stercorigallinarum]
MFESLKNNPNKPQPIGFVEKFAYGLGDFASQMLYTPVGALLIFYYTEYVHVNIATVATIMLLSRFFDGISDLVMGFFIEKTKSPYGKTRVWILRMLIPYFIAMVALFAVPVGWSDFAKYVYIFVSYNFAITVVYTAINLPYGAMSTMMTNDSYQRSIIVIFRMLLATAGNTLTIAATLPMVRWFGNDAFAWTKAFMVLGAIGCFFFFVTFYFCHERIASTPDKERKGNSWQAVKGLFRNSYWVMLTCCMLTIFAADLVFSTANTYYCRYFLGNQELVGVINTILNVFKVGSMIIILPFVLRKAGKRFAVLTAAVCIIFALCARMIDPYNATLAYVAVAFYGLGQGFTYASLFAMIPDTVEYGEYIEHERHEGLVYAGASFGTKLAAGLGAVIASFVMNAGGYVNDAAQQTAEAMNAILYACTLVPAGLYILGILSVLFYKLDKIYPDVIKELGARRARKAVLEN